MVVGFGGYVSVGDGSVGMVVGGGSFGSRSVQRRGVSSFVVCRLVLGWCQRRRL